jgi:transcriptional regulator with XRE-family HTH domain
MPTSETPSRLAVTVASNIRAARLSAGMTQMELASALSVQAMQVSRWERALNTPTTESLMKLADALGVDPASFYAQEKAA